MIILPRTYATVPIIRPLYGLAQLTIYGNWENLLAKEVHGKTPLSGKMY